MTKLIEDILKQRQRPQATLTPQHKAALYDRVLEKSQPALEPQKPWWKLLWLAAPVMVVLVVGVVLWRWLFTAPNIAPQLVNTTNVNNLPEQINAPEVALNTNTTNTLVDDLNLTTTDTTTESISANSTSETQSEVTTTTQVATITERSSYSVFEDFIGEKGGGGDVQFEQFHFTNPLTLSTQSGQGVHYAVDRLSETALRERAQLLLDNDNAALYFYLVENWSASFVSNASTLEQTYCPSLYFNFNNPTTVPSPCSKVADNGFIELFYNAATAPADGLTVALDRIEQLTEQDQSSFKVEQISNIVADGSTTQEYRITLPDQILRHASWVNLGWNVQLENGHLRGFVGYVAPALVEQSALDLISPAEAYDRVVQGFADASDTNVNFRRIDFPLVTAREIEEASDQPQLTVVSVALQYELSERNRGGKETEVPRRFLLPYYVVQAQDHTTGKVFDILVDATVEGRQIMDYNPLSTLIRVP